MTRVGTRKPWVRWVDGRPILLRIGGRPIYADRCCCDQCPTCVWARITVGDAATVQMQLVSAGTAVCLTADPYQVRCAWLPDQRCFVYGEGGVLEAVLYKYCDGHSRLVVNGVPSEPLAGLYGTYTFSEGTGISATVEARDSRLCYGYACVRYVRNHPDVDWDRARVMVPTCAIPQGWEAGWLEDCYGIEDFFACDVVALPGTGPSGNCRWLREYFYSDLCVRKTWYVPGSGSGSGGSGSGSGDREVLGVEEFRIHPCGLFPGAQEGNDACSLYTSAQRWYRDMYSDSDSLMIYWDGTAEYTFVGGMPGGIPGGPYGLYASPPGTYLYGSAEALVYACDGSSSSGSESA